MARRREADKRIIEGLTVAALAAESFLKVYYKAKKELEGVYSPAPQEGKVDIEAKVANAVLRFNRNLLRNSKR